MGEDGFFGFALLYLLKSKGPKRSNLSRFEERAWSISVGFFWLLFLNLPLSSESLLVVAVEFQISGVSP